MLYNFCTNFCFSLNNCKNDRKALSRKVHRQPEVFGHFLTDDHNYYLDDYSITLISKVHSSDCTRRDKYWGNVLRGAAF